MTRTTIGVGLAMVFTMACGGDDDPEAATTVSTTQTSIGTTQSNSETGGDEDDCEPGSEGCACSQGGLCFGDLVCASQLCVDIEGSEGGDEGDTEKPDPTDDPSDPTADPTEDPTDSDSDSGDTAGPSGSCVDHCGFPVPVGDCTCSPGCVDLGTCCSDYEDVCGGNDDFECLVGDDCANDEICTSDLECGSAWGRTYAVCVAYWADYSPTCWDFDDCEADVYFNVYYGGDLQFTSPTQNEMVSASWSECAEVFINSDIDNGFQSNEALSVIFYDADGAGADDLVNIACYNGGNACSFVPVAYLHDGYAVYQNSDAYQFDVTLLFNPLD